MKYIVDKTVEIIKNNLPETDSETMIRIDGFEDLRFYENVAKKVSEYVSSKSLSYNIKLARNKWNALKNNCNNTSYVLSMQQNDWIATSDSITRYRNNHDKNVLILMGTEAEEDKGGLLNCFCITPNTLVKELRGNYSEVFYGLKNYDEDDKNVVNHLYKDLFSFVPFDIYKLSEIADSWEDKVYDIDDFIQKFFLELNEWGMPCRINNLPKIKEICSTRNCLVQEEKFISRSMFKKITATRYKEYAEKLDKYYAEKKEYVNWSGWGDAGFKDYQDFSNSLIAFARGEEISENRSKLEKVDFDIISTILDIKLDKPSPITNPKNKLRGNPLAVFTKALLYQLLAAKDSGTTNIKINIKSADIVNMYTQDDCLDENEQLIKTWKVYCQQINGVISLINRRSWMLDDEYVEIELLDKDIFNPKCAMVKIDEGIIKAASSNKKISKIEFCTICSNDEKKVPKISLKYVWEIPENSEWLFDFKDLFDQELFINNISYIPLAKMEKTKSLLFVKSNEEFFDIYNESLVDFGFNIINLFNDKKIDGFSQYTGKFISLGYAFSAFVIELIQEGFYASLSKESESKAINYINEYVALGDELIKNTMPENLQWILDAYIHAFNIEENEEVLTSEKDSQFCIVPPWHPATLQKKKDRAIFFLDGCMEWWDDCDKGSRKDIDSVINNLEHMSMIQNSVDIFPSTGQQYYSSTGAYGDFTVYARSDIENNTRLKDIIRKEAIFDDDFDAKIISQMNDNAKMIYGVLFDYAKAFQEFNNLNLVFLNPIDLQPIVAAVYNFILYLRNLDPEYKINIGLRILVKPENKGGRNYLAYWMDEFFSQDSNVTIKTYLNECSNVSDVERLVNGNNDIVFAMDLLKINNLKFINDISAQNHSVSECLFPIVYKPTAVSETTVKRKIELSQPQFSASFAHTQVVHFRNNMETKPNGQYIVVKEVCIDNEIQELIHSLHSKAYWVVCIDSGMDGALLRNDEKHKEEYSVIGFSTGKGSYGQYNLTITARQSILSSIERKLGARLKQLFKWDSDKIAQASKLCIKEAGKLDGISLFSAVNQKDQNIHEFMAYVLTSIRENENNDGSILKIMIHLDSYKHWFNSEWEKDDDKSLSRPDFLLLSIENDDSVNLKINATVVECKIAGISTAEQHIEKATRQVEHGIKRLSKIFNPSSNSIKRRYWYAQLYRALTFAQVTFTDNSSEYAELASKLRAVLEGQFDIKWDGKILGYWIDKQGDDEVEVNLSSSIKLVNIPQKVIQELLLPEEDTIEYVNIDDDAIRSDEETNEISLNRENELKIEMDEFQRIKKDPIHNIKIEIRGSKTKKSEIIDKYNSKLVPEVNNEDTYNELEDIKKTISLNEQINSSDDNQNNDIIKKDDIYKNETKTEENESTDMSEKILEDVRVLIGKDKYTNPVYWEFGNKRLGNRHLLITGTSGQGKTYSIQTMLYELSKENISAVVFDYTEGFRLDQLEDRFVENMGDRIKQHIVYYSGVPINPFKRHEIEIAGMTIIEKSSDIAARIANIFKHVYAFGDQQFAAIFEAVHKGIEKYGDLMDMHRFQEMLEEEKEYNKTAQSVLNKMSPFFCSIDFSQDENFSWEKIIYPEKAELNIFQLTQIDREIQVIITELMLWDAWYYTKKVGKKENPFVVVLDEAQNLSHKSNSPSGTILTEGRKFGWSAWFATQSLKILADDEVTRLSQAASKLYFKPTDDEMIKMSKQLDPTAYEVWLKALKNLKKGQCIYVGDRVGLNGQFGNTKPTITNVTSFEERK